MNIRRPLISSSILIAAMAGLSLWAGDRIPADGLIPIHWDIDGKPDGFAPRTFALLFGPATAAALTALLALIPWIEPRRRNLAASAKFYGAAWVGALLVLSIAHVVVVFAALGNAIDAVSLIVGAVAIFLMVIGNYLSKTRSNFFAGVRTPWTLASDYSWERTHRLTARLLIALGAITLVLVLSAGSKIAAYVFMTLLVSAVLAAVVMSYVYWRNDPNRHASDMTPE